MSSVTRLIIAVAAAAGLLAASSCSSGTPGGNGSGGDDGMVIKITGSDTMVNLAQAWAENYANVAPEVSIQIAGGGSGVGFANLTDNIVDIATASRAMKDKEMARARQNGVEPVEFIVGRDALGVYVHAKNPIASISIEQLAEIYGEGGTIETWAQLGQPNPSCAQGTIELISRQSNSGTYHYFREAVVGKGREFKLGSVDQSGSKDVVALVGNTPCAIGYSGMAYVTPEVKLLPVAAKTGGEAVSPTKASAASGAYPIARPLFLYTNGEPEGIVKDFLDWVRGPEGQKIVDEIGYVPMTPVPGPGSGS